MKLFGNILFVLSIVLTVATIYTAQVSSNGCDNVAMLSLLLFLAIFFATIGAVFLFKSSKKNLSQRMAKVLLVVLLASWMGEGVQIYHLSSAAIGDCYE
ncbi:MAG: hypothetical protein H6626_05405 [Pseudobdellovibrionaceae bacterium]|nr:MAG: hypothetical protein H6626_05405 [Pseudobdellovibrionaceae bacterium]